jgi:hypothetical protein
MLIIIIAYLYFTFCCFPIYNLTLNSFITFNSKYYYLLQFNYNYLFTYHEYYYYCSIYWIIFFENYQINNFYLFDFL